MLQFTQLTNEIYFAGRPTSRCLAHSLHCVERILPAAARHCAGRPLFLVRSQLTTECFWLLAGDKYEIASIDTSYKTFMKLKIKGVDVRDFVSYKCVAKNSLGETDGVIKLEGKPFFSFLKFKYIEKNTQSIQYLFSGRIPSAVNCDHAKRRAAGYQQNR